jgi:hypothetical protein
VKLQTIVAAIASLAALTGAAGSASVPVGAAIHLPTIGFGHYGPPYGQATTFELDGRSVSSLYPGLTKPIQLRLRNPYPFDLKVTSLAGVVVASNKRACPAKPSNLVALPYNGTLPFSLKAGQGKSVGAIPIRMPRSVTDECKKVTFTVRLYGTAMKVHK